MLIEMLVWKYRILRAGAGCIFESIRCSTNRRRSGFTTARGCTARTFAHACIAHERPLFFGFTRPRSRGANTLKEPIKPFVSCRLFLPSRISAQEGRARTSLPLLFHMFYLPPLCPALIPRSVVITASISRKRSS